MVEGAIRLGGARLDLLRAGYERGGGFFAVIGASKSGTREVSTYPHAGRRIPAFETFSGPHSALVAKGFTCRVLSVPQFGADPIVVYKITALGRAALDDVARREAKRAATREKATA